MKIWHEIKSEFRTDGSLRDIYVENINSTVWEAFIKSVKNSEYKIQFNHGEVVKILPNTFTEIKELRETEHTTLWLWLSKEIQINCHFFIDSEIELDVSPSDIQDEVSYLKLINFMQWLSSALKHEVKLTHEGSQDQVILSVG